MTPKPAAGEPAATYRIQFHQGFRFVDGRDLVPYLSDLGITDLYSSPRYKARRGSAHGYDIADPLRINSEVGTEDDFNEMAEKLRHYGMGLLQDTVPNHMSASYENPWWKDVLESGPASAYAIYFDIDWHPATSKAAFLQENRVLLPVLGDLYGNILTKGELTLKIEDTGIHLRYYDRRLPIDPKNYSAILELSLAQNANLPEISEILEDVRQLPARNEMDLERILDRRRNKERIKQRLWTAYQGNAEVRRAIDEALLTFSGTKENPRSFDALDRLLSEQAYRLAYWKIGYEEINYRRFFDINELVGLRIEVPEVFERRHRNTFDLIRDGKVTSLRIDHIDGLWDPGCYLRRLQTRAAEGAPLYVVVEKILGRDEPLPREWPVNGTTGYDFLNALNGIFIEPNGLARIEAAYALHTGSSLPFAELCYAANKQVIQQLFTGEVNALAHHLGKIAAEHRSARDIRLSELMEALVEITACLPVYRTYIHSFEISERDRGYIERTLALARRRTSRDRISDAAFEFIRSVLLLQPPYDLEQKRNEWLDFVMRWQQFTGPVMAKGLEDTAMYRHNSLLSLNEVGGDPLRERPPFTLKEFHEFNQRRLRDWPGTLNATATHDTKRGEDVRARLNVLTEMPDEWQRHLERWSAWSQAKKIFVNGSLAPTPSEEILIYQTLLGAWPANDSEAADFPDRVKEFLTKALREAKQNSSWLEPHEGYEGAVREFVDRILAPDGQFLHDFRDFRATIARHGAINGLSQLLIKVVSPGVPDFYQGTELWQLTLVDPDNRRPVDYTRRAAMLDTLHRRESEDRIALIRELAAHPMQDEMKLYVMHRALAYRRGNRALFARGEYLPMEARGARAEHVCAFARKLDDQYVVVVAPRWPSLIGNWEDTELTPPAADREWRDVITNLLAASWRLADLLAEFPVALLAAT
ncbi:MAG TPA: malto-oligosyltrehalose synthase [Bryobacteraceae bacterium]|nr:malto-oligosyltrehalose synthase [Bryobacteraceae bacterium]